jgi:hypothetical protein
MDHHVDIVNELGSILRGEHPAWRGDRRANGGLFLRIIRDDMPGLAAALADDLRRNLNDFAELSEVSPRTLTLAAMVLSGDTIDL